MPAALYTISHKETRHVLAIASFEKKTTLTDEDAWDDLRKTLVGEDKLTLPTFGTHKKLELATDQLAVDEVEADAATTKALYDDPYKYEIAERPDSAPGDGKPKTLNTPGNKATPSLSVTTNTLTVTLANPPTLPMPVWVVFEGEGPKFVTITAPSTTATFSIATPLAANPYLVLVLAMGAPAFVGLVTPT